MGRQASSGNSSDESKMRTLQVIQTLMLMAIIIGTVENSSMASKMESTVREMSGEASRLSKQLQRLSEEHYALEHRVTSIEARVK